MKNSLLASWILWEKATPVPGLDDSIWRDDANGNRIKFSDYGKSNSPYGWEADHYPVPKSMGGSDKLDNLRPLRCTENRSHGGFLGAAIQNGRPAGLLSSLMATEAHKASPQGGLLGQFIR